MVPSVTQIGEVHYNGVEYDCLDVKKEGDVCLLENDDVRVVNMGGERWYNITETMSYDCYNATDAINGAYSPALDAFFIGTSTCESVMVVICREGGGGEGRGGGGERRKERKKERRKEGRGEKKTQKKQASKQERISKFDVNCAQSLSLIHISEPTRPP